MNQDLDFKEPAKGNKNKYSDISRWKHLLIYLYIFKGKQEYKVKNLNQQSENGTDPGIEP